MNQPALSALVPVVLLIAVGFLAGRLGWLLASSATDLSNLVLLCTVHHKLGHEHGWRLRREPTGEVRWFRPGGAPYHAGPDPPRQAVPGA